MLYTKGGAVRSTYGYTAYGKMDKEAYTFKGKNNPDPNRPDPYNVYRYNHKRWDPHTQNYDMGFRNYSPGLNRFLTRDMYNGALSNLRISTDPFTMNRYAFAGGNPISNVELDGHMYMIAAGGGGGSSGSSDSSSGSSSSSASYVGSFLSGAREFALANVSLGLVEDEKSNPVHPKTYEVGQLFGDLVTTLVGLLEIGTGAAGEVGGVALDATGVGAVVGVPLNVASAGLIAHAAATTGNSLKSTVGDTKDLFTYIKGSSGRADDSYTVARNGRQIFRDRWPKGTYFREFLIGDDGDSMNDEMKNFLNDFVELVSKR
ncbi:MAG TPA: RHS repeat-associated core domain-containing protein [Bacillales bacterium]|nr:RHS repeat-associated core domain-containing protein [Bacillales bacterium]